jgi:hypothetical protein
MSISFQQVLDMVESLPEYQQEDLIDLIHRRLIEQKRETLALRVQEGRTEYAQGKTKEGTVQDLIINLFKRCPLSSQIKVNKLRTSP